MTLFANRKFNNTLTVLASVQRPLILLANTLTPDLPQHKLE